MPISTVKILKGLTTGLCLSGFELYSRWVPLSVVSIVHQIYIYTFLLVQNTQLKLFFRELSAKLFSLFVI